MLNPVRLRLSRAKGFDLQAHSQSVNGLDAVNVARPGPWGNPFVVGKDGTREQCVRLFSLLLQGYACLTSGPHPRDQLIVRATMIANIETLRGKNLACWCLADRIPCHADQLLILSNSPQCDEVLS